MLAGLFVNEEPEATDTDEYWLAQGYVTVVPVDSDMTARSAVAAAATTYDTAMIAHNTWHTYDYQCAPEVFSMIVRTLQDTFRECHSNRL